LEELNYKKKILKFLKKIKNKLKYNLNIMQKTEITLYRFSEI